MNYLLALEKETISFPDLGWNFKKVFGAAMLGGIGFTMSIFVTMLAFKDPSYINEAKLMILLASVSAALLGFFFLKIVLGKNLVVIAGEITSKANVDIEKIVRNAIKEIGYTDEKTDIDYKTCQIIINLSKQSPDIALGV